MVLRILFIISVFTLCSCKKTVDPKIDPYANINGTYFSIIDFTKDQWATYKGQPFGITKRVTFNGTKDSLMTNAIHLDWASVFKVFFETDLGDRKYLGKYDFSGFADTTSMTKNFIYEANEPKLYTKKLHIIADYFSNKITSIYIEAEKNDRVGTKNVKLFYLPLEKITIHEVEVSKAGKKKDMRVEYDFN